MTHTCLHCDARLSDAEVAGGWCETCGKRVPSSLTVSHRRARAEQEPSIYEESARAAARQPAGAEGVEDAGTAGGCLRPFVCGLLGAVAGMILGALMFPHSGLGQSILGGVGCATGSALGRALRGRDGRGEGSRP